VLASIAATKVPRTGPDSVEVRRAGDMAAGLLFSCLRTEAGVAEGSKKMEGATSIHR
jgi:hypothetical protein